MQVTKAPEKPKKPSKPPTSLKPYPKQLLVEKVAKEYREVSLSQMIQDFKDYPADKVLIKSIWNQVVATVLIETDPKVKQEFQQAKQAWTQKEKQRLIDAKMEYEFECHKYKEHMAEYTVKLAEWDLEQSKAKLAKIKGLKNVD
jgi:hypothetical protein